MEAAENIARIVWETNRQLQIADGEDWPDVPWDSAPEERKNLCRGTVELVCDGSITSPQVAHEHWTVGMAIDGWIWSHEKDLQSKHHPSLIPWNELTPRAQLGQRFLVFITTEMMRATEA